MRGHFKVRLKLAGGEEEQVPRRKSQGARSQAWAARPEEPKT